MLREIRLLLRPQLLALFGFNKARYAERGSREGRRLSAFAVLMAVLTLFFLALAGFYSYGGAILLQMAGRLDLLLPLMMTLSCLVNLFTTIWKAQGLLFHFRDYDALMSLPFRTSSLVASRLVLLYGMNLAFTLLILLPAGVVYILFAAPSAVEIAGFVLALPAVPLLPVVLAAALGLLIGLAASRFRWKNAASILLSVLLVVGLMALSFALPQAAGELESLGALLADAVGHSYPPSLLFGRACGGDLWSLLLFDGLSLAVGALFCWYVGARFRAWNARLTAGRAGSAYRAKPLREAGPTAALFRKELRRYLSSPLYVMNTAVGMILLLLASIALLILGPAKLEAALEMPGLENTLQTALPLAVLFFTGLSSTTSSSLSLEGVHLPFLKSLPVTPRQIFHSKLAVNLLVISPAAAVSAVLLGIAVRPGWAAGLLLFLLPQIHAAFTALFGLAANLLYPNFEWTSETQVIKQSAATMIAVLGGMGLSALLLALTLWLQQWAAPVLLLSAAALLLLAADIFLYRWLMTKGIQKFQKL